MSSIFTKSFLILLKAVKAARGGKYVHREFVGTSVDKKGKIKNKWHYFYNQGTLQKELAEWKAQFEAKQAKQKRNLFATPADIKGVEHKEKEFTEYQSNSERVRESQKAFIDKKEKYKGRATDSQGYIIPQNGEKVRLQGSSLLGGGSYWYGTITNNRVNVTKISDETGTHNVNQYKKLTPAWKLEDDPKIFYNESQHLIADEKRAKERSLTESKFLENTKSITKVIPEKNKEYLYYSNTNNEPVKVRILSEETYNGIKDYEFEILEGKNKGSKITSGKLSDSNFFTMPKEQPKQTSVATPFPEIKSNIENETSKEFSKFKLALSDRQKQFISDYVDYITDDSKLEYTGELYKDVSNSGIIENVVANNKDIQEINRKSKYFIDIQKPIPEIKKQLEEKFKIPFSVKLIKDGSMKGYVSFSVIKKNGVIPTIPFFERIKLAKVSTPANSKEILPSNYGIKVFVGTDTLHNYSSDKKVSTNDITHPIATPQSTSSQSEPVQLPNDAKKLESLKNEFRLLKQYSNAGYRQSANKTKTFLDVITKIPYGNYISVAPKLHSVLNLLGIKYEQKDEGTLTKHFKVLENNPLLNKTMGEIESLINQKLESTSSPDPVQPMIATPMSSSFDEHIASQNLTPKQLEVSKQVYNTVKDLPESELRLRLDRLSKLPVSNGIAGITAINYVLGLSRSEAMLGNQNAAGRHNVESRTIPELNEVLASTSDKDYMANVIKQIEANRILPMTIDNLKSAIAALPVKDNAIIEKLVRSMITQNQVNYNKTVTPNPISDKFREEQLKKNNEALSNKFNALADSMEKTIDSKINSAIGRQNLTARRARISGGMYEEGQKLKQVQSVLRGMANAVKNNDLPQELQNVKSRKDVDTIVRYAILQERENNQSALPKWQQGRSFDYTKDNSELRRLGITSKEKLLDIGKIVNGLQKGYTAPDPKLKKIKDLETKLIGQKIPDFFPTPKRIIEDMISRADIQSGMKVLEPSAGKGDIADALKEAGAEVDTIEPVYSLSDILKEKGHNVLDTQDFLDLNEKYDRIVMNPPFGKGADMKHVRHAYDLLKPGGKLVAIMGEGGFFRSDNQSKEFRNWLDSVNSDVEKLPEGSFRGVDSFVQTGANTRMVTITKPNNTMQKSNILTLLKGKKAQEGEVRTWGNGKKFKKVGGKWQPVAGDKKKAEPKQKKEKKKGETKESNTGFSMKPFAEIKRIAQYTKEADFDKEKIEQYKNSIAEHGYDPAFPMVIDKDKKTGVYNVVAGNHRYKAVEALISEGKLPQDFEIPTVMREFEDENARLAYQVRENQRRDPLPTDEANAYKKMADNGWDAARIAKELGQPVGKITKRLALSNLSPDLFNLVSKKGIPVGIAEAIGLGSVEEESGKPNHTIQLKAYQFYRDNKGKGYGAGEVLSFIRELKSNASQKFFENDGKSDTEKEALRSVGSEEKAKRNVKLLDNTFKTMQKALSQLMGDSVGQINPKLAKELSASIVAAQGESEFSNKMKQLDTVIQDMQLMKEAFMKSFKGMKDDSTMGMMFASSINTMIHSVNKHTKAIETAKAINKMLSMAYKTKYKLHDQSVKARLAA